MRRLLKLLLLTVVLLTGVGNLAWAGSDSSETVSGSLVFDDLTEQGVSSNSSTAGDITVNTNFAIGKYVTMTACPKTSGDYPTRFWMSGGKKELRIYAAPLKFAVNEKGQSIKKIVLNITKLGTITSNVGEVATSDNAITWTGDASEVEFTITKQIRVISVEAESGEAEESEATTSEFKENESYAQGEKAAGDGMLLTFGGNNTDAQYVFNAVKTPVDNFNTLTEGIGQVPVDDNDNAFDPEQKNLPTKGTYYVFEPTKDGQLAVTVKQEAKKPLFVTEDGEILKGFNGITSNEEFNGTYTFDVKATKAYYVFTTGANLGLYGFQFTPANEDATNIAKDIASFKLLPLDNAEGDTLKLNNAIVTYIKGDNVFVEDESGATVFANTGIQFYVGQQLNGFIVGQNHEEKHMPQLLKTANTKYTDFKASYDFVTPEAKAISVAEATKKESLARFVKLTNVKAATDDWGFQILLDEENGNSIRLEDYFNLFNELDDNFGSIEGIVGINADSTFVFWPTSKEGIIPEEPSSDVKELEDGKYVLKNIASGLFWGAGNNWGTRASLLDYSEFQTLAKQPDGTYTMESQVSNGGTSYFFGGDYMDGNPVNLTITPVQGTEASEEPLVAAMFKHYASIDAAEGTETGCSYELDKASGLPYGDGNVNWLNYADLIDYDKLIVTVSEGAPRFCMNRTEDNAQDSGDPATTKFIDIAIGNGKWGSDAYLTKEDNTYTLDLKKMREERGLVHLHSIKGANWVDVTVTSMTLTKAAQPGYYTVANGDQYFGYSTTEDAPYTKGTAILGKGLSADDVNARWEIVPATAESLAKATEKNPVDATFLILNPNFGRNNRNGEAWTMEAGNKNMSGGTNENRCAESWRSAFTLSQEIEVPNGVYALTAQAALTDYADLYDGNEYPVVYANEETAPFKNMEGSDRGSNMNTLSAAFANGNYKVNTIYVTVTDGKLTIGVKGTRTDTWCIWDNFQLKYYGTDANIENLKGGAESKELDDLRNKANELLAEVEIAAVKTALQNAINETANVSGADAIKAAIATLTAAVDLGEASVTAKKVLPKMKELIDATNVYTEEAYNEYYGTWLAKYEAGTLTKAEASGLQDPSVVTGWHAQITVDNFLLSAWDTNPDFNNAAYYINSWSVEGDSDGSDFHVPFFEYWTGDDSSLGEKTLTATMEGLAAGEYNVSAWVRVRMKNGAEAPTYGIDMQANDGAAVDVAAGTQIGESQFFIDNFTATGTVGADGVLTIKFNVAADNNISWLSFKNVKFEKVGGDVADDLIEIPQDQGKTLDDFTRTDFVEGAEYNTYTAHGDLNIAFKMVNIDVKDCDYVIIKFAEPVAAGWHLAFWSGQDLVDVPAGATEYKYVFAEDPKCDVKDGILPQICMMTFFGGFEAPLVAKVTGIYKHKVAQNLVAGSETELDATGGSTKNEQVDGTSYYIPGEYIAGKGSSMANGMTSKGFKLRTANGTDPKESAVFMVKEGYTITDLTINAVGNYTALAEGPIYKVTKVEVDGKEVNFTDGAFPSKGAENCGTLTISGISAKQSIKLYFDNSNAGAKDTQMNIAYAINYLEDTTVGVEEVKNDIVRIDNDAIYNLRGQKMTGTLKPGLYIKNGKKFIVK